MNKVKAIFFDIDGTLFSHTLKKVPESTWKALHLLREKGIKLCIASGRSIDEFKKLEVAKMDFDAYVTLNGQICYDNELHILYRGTVEPEDTEKIVQLFQEKKVPIAVVKENELYLNFINQYVEKVQQDITSALPPIKEYQGEEVCQFIFYTTPENAAELIGHTKNCKIHQWNPYAVDVLHKDCGKAVSIARILSYYGFQKEEIMAFGDGENDIDMLSYAGIGVAMGNAPDLVKDSADYVTSSIDEDGIWKALEYFDLIS